MTSTREKRLSQYSAFPEYSYRPGLALDNLQYITNILLNFSFCYAPVDDGQGAASEVSFALLCFDSLHAENSSKGLAPYSRNADKFAKDHRSRSKRSCSYFGPSCMFVNFKNNFPQLLPVILAADNFADLVLVPIALDLVHHLTID
jgi:hypothetical protein